MQTCTRCIMTDVGDPLIQFDSQGICNYCTEALLRKEEVYFPNEDGNRKLQETLVRLKEKSQGKAYDCMMGVSGGLDSSYLAFLGATKWGLRILAVHVDDGYDTDISKKNLAQLAALPNLSIATVVPDAEEFNELTRAYMLAGVPNLAVPQDNILFSYLYKTAASQKIDTFLAGGNFALESILQKGNTHDCFDVVNIRDIYKHYGRRKLTKLKFLSHFRRDLYFKMNGISTLYPLNWIDYNREHAFTDLFEGCGFQYYGSKHLENTLTKFIQTYWLYHKFGVDKRTSHLSSMIVSGQLTREKAMELIALPINDESEMQHDINTILNRLDISNEQFENIMETEPRQHNYYRTSKYNQRVQSFKRLLKGGNT